VPTLIYHITHVNNLSRILQTNGLWCDAERVRQRFDSVGIAHEQLKERRARTRVGKVAAGGMLADYVPFYFANRSPMLYSIHTGYVAGYDGGQEKVVYLVSSVERVAQGDRRWCFTDGHAVEAITTFFDTLEELSQVDWSVIASWKWGNINTDPDRRRRKQAEFLVHQSFPWLWIEQIGVVNMAMKEHVQNILVRENAVYRPLVAVQQKWYYST
jgi:hypothetical protein